MPEMAEMPEIPPEMDSSEFIKALPEEIWIHILQYLSSNDVKSFGSTGHLTEKCLFKEFADTVLKRRGKKHILINILK